MFDLHTGNLKAVIQTGNGKPGTVGQRRADELCYNPVSDVVLVANDDPLDNFIAFIGEDSLKVLQRIKFDGTDPNGAHILANGIEQCVFDPRDGKFWLNIPNTGASTLATPLPGVVLRISGRHRSTSSRYSTSRRRRWLQPVVAERPGWQSALITKLDWPAAAPML